MAEPLKLLLADDDIDDCMFFQEVLAELKLPVSLTIVNNGEELMELLRSGAFRPNAIYLDLNMPRKNGFECLVEIKSNEALKSLPVIIYSTSLDHEVTERIYRSGASYYIRKPSEFQLLKDVIHKSIQLISDIGPEQTTKEKFMVTGK